MSNIEETELKKAWDMIIDYCDTNLPSCKNCIFICKCGGTDLNEKIEE